jgi:hypothetical protein
MGGTGRIVLVLATLLATSACGYDRALAAVADEPILGPPPGARELLRSETAGSAIGFGTPARVEVVWGLRDAEEAAAWYLREHAGPYQLSRQGTEDRWLGTRAGEVAMTVSVTVVRDVADLGVGALIGGPAEEQSWDGPVAVARVSSTDD